MAPEPARWAALVATAGVLFSLSLMGPVNLLAAPVVASLVLAGATPRWSVPQAWKLLVAYGVNIAAGVFVLLLPHGLARSAGAYVLTAGTAYLCARAGALHVPSFAVPILIATTTTSPAAYAVGVAGGASATALLTAWFASRESGRPQVASRASG